MKTLMKMCRSENHIRLIQVQAYWPETGKESFFSVVSERIHDDRQLQYEEDLAAVNQHRREGLSLFIVGEFFCEASQIDDDDLKLEKESA